MNDSLKEREGLVIKRISEDEFRELARRHGKSPEIGPIATALDDPNADPNGKEIHAFGLTGCGLLCGAVCLTLTKAKQDDSLACKLDSVIVNGQLRKRGLGAIMVAQSFLDILDHTKRNISTMYAHSVHPATVKLLRRLTFQDPGPTGAPISSIQINETTEKGLTDACRDQIHTISSDLKLHCAYCRQNSRRTRRWCLHR